MPRQVTKVAADDALTTIYRPGTGLEVIEVASYLGTVTVRVGRRELVLGPDAARRTRVPE